MDPMGEPATVNWRKKPRFTRRLRVRFGTESQMRGGTILDISEGGIRIQATEPFPVNSLLQVFVQFPRNALRLQARVAWVGSGRPVMGLALANAEPNLTRQYQSWLAEVKQAAQETEEDPVVDQPAPVAKETAPPAAEPPAAPKKSPNKQQGSVRRRVETMQGQTYDILLERISGEWYLTIHQLPRQPGVEIPNLDERFSDYESADRAMRDFLKSH